VQKLNSDISNVLFALAILQFQYAKRASQLLSGETPVPGIQHALRHRDRIQDRDISIAWLVSGPVSGNVPVVDLQESAELFSQNISISRRKR
jgi:hypothetical protein